MLLRYLNDNTFLYWHNVFQTIAKKVYWFSLLKNSSINDFEIRIQNARDPIDQNEKPHQKCSRSVIVKEVCVIITNQVKDRFNFLNHLIATKLFYCEDLNTFSDKSFNTTVSNYAAFDKYKLKIVQLLFCKLTLSLNPF